MEEGTTTLPQGGRGPGNSVQLVSSGLKVLCLLGLRGVGGGLLATWTVGVGRWPGGVVGAVAKGRGTIPGGHPDPCS